MASYANQIANAVVSVIAALPDAPSTVKYRKQNVQYTIDTNPAVVVSIGNETPGEYTTGGTIFKTYTVGIEIYRDNPGNLTSAMDTNTAFVLSCKQALDGTSLTGVPVVWKVDLIESPEWEGQPFGQASEISTFGLLVYTNEPRN